MLNLYGKNTTSGSILVSSWKTYSTNSTNVGVIEVQSISDDSLFNAYKFIYNQVPYYYVVDGSHNYWVSDLSSIGYKLYEEPSYEFILVDDSTGRVTHGVESLNQIEFSPTGYFLIESDTNVIFVVELPTVSTTGDWDDGNQLYPYGGGSSINTFFAVGEVKDAITDGSSTETVPYNSENSYCIFDWFTKDAIGLSDVVLVNNNGNLAFSNVSDHTFNIRWFNVAVCSSNQASVVTVYDSGNTAYNSFKYTIDNIDYYYVLDGIQNIWTNDLSSIGYSLTPPVVLPTVTALPTIGQDTASIASQGHSYALRRWDAGGWYGTYISVDAAKVYAIHEYADGNGGYKSPVGIFETTSVGGSLGAKNISSSSQNFRAMKSYSCSDSTATVVTVYNSSNVAYNAFKFTASGTDYYYVLDGTQTDWTDDLASIGYSLTPVTKRGYAYAQMYYAYGDTRNLTYTAAGSDYIPANTSKKYVVVSISSSPSFDASSITLFNDISPARLTARANSPFHGSLWYVDYYEVDV